MRWWRNAWELHRLVAASVSRERRGQRARKAGYESMFMNRLPSCCDGENVKLESFLIFSSRGLDVWLKSAGSL